MASAAQRAGGGGCDHYDGAVERADPAVFTDLNLDQVFAGVTAGRWVGRGRDSARHVKVKLITR
jgi:hypothetical protein